MAKFLGIGGSVTINSVLYNVKEWQAEDSAEAIDVTNTGCVGTDDLVYRVKITGPRSLSGTFTVIMDAGALLAAMPVGVLYTGAPAATFNFGYGPGTLVNAGSITCTSILITKCGIKQPAQEDVEVEFSFQASGSFTV